MSKPVILCVDDEPLILESLRRHLGRSMGRTYAIVMATDGREALKIIEDLLAENREIPLVISDYIMPGLRGDRLLERVHELSPETLKIMLTGQADIEAVSHAINNARLYRYISKPWEVEDLRLTIEKAIDSYFQQKKLLEQQDRLEQMNRELARLTREQAASIAQLNRNESRLTQFLEAMPVGIMVVDASVRYLFYLNQKAQSLLGQGPLPDVTVDRIAQAYRICVAGSDRLYPTEGLPVTRALNGEIATADNLEIHRGDRVVPVEMWGKPIYDDRGDITYAIGAFQDITDRKQAEAEREKLICELYDSNTSLEVALKNEQELADAAQRFVPNEFLSFLGYDSLTEIALGRSVQKEMSIVFADIRDFTRLSETMKPEDNFKFINGYLSQMEPAIIENGGFIDKYIGDAIMALFGGSADDAVRAGISMLHRLHDYNYTRGRPDRPIVKIGIGINTGELVLGTVGGQYRLDSTAIGDAVNLAARIEGLTKEYGLSLLIGHETFYNLEDASHYCIRAIDRVQVKGKSERVSVFEVFDADPPELREGKLVTRTEFERSLVYYYLGQFAEAAQSFEECLRQTPEDTVARIYLERSQQSLGSSSEFRVQSSEFEDST